MLLLADNYWAGLLTPEILLILFTQISLIFLNDIYISHTRIVAPIIDKTVEDCHKISRRLCKIPGDFQDFQEEK